MVLERPKSHGSMMTFVPCQKEAIKRRFDIQTRKVARGSRRSEKSGVNRGRLLRFGYRISFGDRAARTLAVDFLFAEKNFEKIS